MSTYFILFLAGMLTILLPCILPLIPIVLGVSIAGRSKLRPLYTILGMIISFVGFTFLLLVVLRQFVLLADVIRIATYYVLVLFGIGFMTHMKWLQYVVAVLGSLLFMEKGIEAVALAAVLGVVAMEVGGMIAGKLQTLGVSVQGKAREEFGQDSPLTAFVIGLTLGLVWVPCAGPALSFALTLVRDEPGLRAFAALLSYALGTALPLLLIGYGGQAAVHSVRSVSRYSGTIKQVSGALLIITAIALHFRAFEKLQVWLLDHTSFGDIGTRIEERLFSSSDSSESSVSSVSSSMQLPKLSRAPELSQTGEWFNSDPFTLESLRGKVVLIDFWTYSCINCIRTLPYIQGYWDKYKDTDKFVLLGVHTPEFAFEKLPKNVQEAITRHSLTYPVVQDNDFGTWQQFANRYWPAKYLVDAEGYIRYTHFGEGAYEETDEAISSLLEELEVSIDQAVQPSGLQVKSEESLRMPRSTETYLSSRSWPAFGSAQGDPDGDVHSYLPFKTMELHKYYLIGDWQLMSDEHQVSRSDKATIVMMFQGGEANLVLGSEDGAPITVGVVIDGVKTKTITVDRHDLYNVFDGPYGEHSVRLEAQRKGLQGFAWTFGG
ncbi:MAG: cytochrome c biogenesis protein CcdA [Candidatus Peribacteraceae bacterium]